MANSVDAARGRPAKEEEIQPDAPKKDREPVSEAIRRRELREVWLFLALQPLLFAGANLVFFTQAVNYYNIFIVVRQAYTFNTVLLPCSLAVAGGIGWWTWRVRRPGASLRWASWACLAAAFLCVAARIYATNIEPRMLMVRQVDIVTPKVDHPIRILHISDIQSDRIGSYERRAFERMRSLRPDLVLFTGDLLQPLPPCTFQTELPKIASLLETLNPPLGKFWVPGDVDGLLHRLADKELGGLKMLESADVSVSSGRSRLRILGLSTPESAMGAPSRVERWLESADPSDFTIVLGHMPDYAMSLQDVPVDLCLAGHTHGGQVRIPFYGPIVTLSAVPKDWALGFRSIGKTRLNVTAGVGCEHGDSVQPIRLFCPPDMTLIQLLPAAENKTEKDGARANG